MPLMEIERTPEQRAADRRTFLRDVAVLLGLPLIAIVAALVWWRPWAPDYTPPSGTDIHTLVTGTWDWSTRTDSTFCQTTQHTIAFSSDRRTMSITQWKPWTDDDGVERQVSVYDIEQIAPSRIRGAIRGETRTTDAGVPVVWDLVITSPDSYAWHRTDWPAVSLTDAIRRCPASTPAATVAAPPG